MTVTSVHKDPEAPTMTITAELDTAVERAWQLWADPGSSSGGGGRRPTQPRSSITTSALADASPTS